MSMCPGEPCGRRLTSAIAAGGLISFFLHSQARLSRLTEGFVRLVQHVRLEIPDELLVLDRGVDFRDRSGIERLTQSGEPSA